MDSNVLIALIGVAGTIGGVYFGHRLNKNTAKEAVDLAFEKTSDLLKNYEFLKARNELKNAFSNTIELTSNGYFVNKFVERLFDNEIPAQETAFIKFAAHLPSSRRDEFRKAWQDYKCTDKSDFILEYRIDDTHGVKQDKIENEESKKRILDRIETLLKLTNV